ncbi:MAG: hypothetical protein NTW74_12345, partial [Acidobacteria bacterium]|nr:hypothetical protein [Acidobacteriota bacterium]
MAQNAKSPDFDQITVGTGTSAPIPKSPCSSLSKGNDSRKLESRRSSLSAFLTSPAACPTHLRNRQAKMSASLTEVNPAAETFKKATSLMCPRAFCWLFCMFLEAIRQQH